MKSTTKKIPIDQIGIRQSPDSEDCWEVAVIADDEVVVFEIPKEEFKKIKKQGYITFGTRHVEAEQADVGEFPPTIH